MKEFSLNNPKVIMYKFRMKKKSILVTLILLIYLLPIAAQDASNTIGRVSISSPNAAALGKYGDVPVNNHTGIPNISIPVYTIKSAKLELPIDLSYHASGLKVQEQASWVGAGWSLNAGGMITRTVRGAADDRGNNNGYVTHGYYSDSGYYNYSFHPDGGFSAQTNGLGPDDEQFVASRKDGEPDIYTFNFGGYNGKFYFNDDQSPVLVPEADFKIETDFVAGPGFQGFVITPPDGTKYYFGKTGNNSAVHPIEITYSITTQNSYGLSSRTASSWFLNKIVSFDKTDSITLNYQQENYSYYTTAMFPLYYGGFLPTGSTGWNAYTYEYDLVKNFTQGVRLSGITYPNGTVSFNAATTPRTDLAGFTDQSLTDAPNTEAKALSSIQITNNGTACKKMNLYYSYFYDNQNGLNGLLFQNNYPILQNIHSDAYRLKLDSLQEISCTNNIKVPPYKFDYFTELVPRKLSFGIDHWGFYNGVTSNTTLIPENKMITDHTFVEYPGANRDAAWPAMRGGSLKKIIYPTGGFTQLDFEAHSTYTNFTHYVSTNVLSLSAGYDGHNGFLGDGGGNPANYSFTFTGNPYKITLSNTNNGIIGSAATVEIKTPNTGTVILNMSANPGETKTENLIITPGTYTVFINKEYATASKGATASFNEQIPTLSNGNSIVGGLRIKTITSNDGVTNLPNIKSYTYNINNIVNGNSSGILYSRPIYVQVIRNNIFGAVWGSTPGLSPYGCSGLVQAGNEIHNSYKSPASIRPMETTQGNHIGYNEVYVSQTNNGYSVYRYYGSNLWDNITADVCKREFVNSTICDPSIPNYPAAPVEFEYMRGELKYEAHFNQSNQIQKDIWYYPEYTKNLIPTPGHIAFSSSDIKSFTDYSLYTYKKTKSTITTTDYTAVSGSIANTSTTYYGSPFHNQPTQSIMLSSKNDNIITNMKYAADFRIAACDAQPDSLTYYLNRINADNARFSTTTATCTPQNVGDYTNCRYLAMIKLRYDLMLSRRLYMNFLKRTYSNANSVYNTCHLNAKSTANSELKPILEMQDKYQNPVIETTKWRNSNLTSASFNRYDYVTNPSGYIYPQRTQKINIQSPSVTFTNASVSGNTIVKDSRYEDESFVKFENGNVVEVKGKDGIYTAYIWGYTNTLPVAEATGVTYAILKAAFDAAGGDLNLMRGQTTLSKAFVNTYFYTPGVGMIKKTDPNNKNTFYEYDELNRLKYIRDQDNNIIKKFCYNYAGQVENCAN
jgi:hypothetical protein